MKNKQHNPFAIVLCVCSFLFLSSSTRADAFRDKRLALLVANEEGWKGDPRLKYAIQGDLYPLARSLQRIGFEVRILKNRDVHSIRRVFSKLNAYFRQNPSIRTFLFYYSGHADRTFFHFGKRTTQPMEFREFASFFKKLRVPRRIAIIDSCFSGQIIRQFGSLKKFKKLHKRGRHKGVRAHRAINIRKLMQPDQGREFGMRIISSSLHLSWEINRYKASIFTHHLLQGLQNKADLNRDGKITIDELFDYASREVNQETGQRPQQLVWVQREQPYALAPAYYSRLIISPTIVGHLNVRVGNFVWSYHKRKKETLRLATVDGTGRVRLRYKNTCWKQDVLLPKGGELKLSPHWNRIRCRRSKKNRKGSLLLPPRFYNESRADTSAQSQLVPFSLHRFVGLSLGYTQLGASTLYAPSLSATFHFRFDSPLERFTPEHPSFWSTQLMFRNGFDITLPFRLDGVGLAANGAPFDKGLRWMGRANLRSEGGWSIPFHFFGALVLFPHFYVQLSGTLLQLEDRSFSASLLAGGGATLEITWWLGRRIGLHASAQAGVDYALSTIGSKHLIFFHLKSYMGLLLSI